MKCEVCEGKGYIEYEHGLIMVECEACNGTGEIPEIIPIEEDSNGDDLRQEGNGDDLGAGRTESVNRDGGDENSRKSEIYQECASCKKARAKAK